MDGYSDNAPSMQTLAPSGIGIVGPMDQINSPVAASTGATSQQGQQMLSGSDKNTPPGPPVFKWNKYDFVWNGYWGVGGFYDGTVLRKMLAELDDQYLLRRALAFYRNFFRQIIDATYKPVFASGSTFQVQVNGVVDSDGTKVPLFHGFLENVDNRHTSLAAFIKKSVKNSRILGVSYVVVDNFPDMPDGYLVKDALKDRKYPYVYIRLPQQTEEKSIVLDEFSKIQEIMFKEAPEKVLNEQTKQPELEPRWRKWTTQYSVKVKRIKDTGEFVEIKETMKLHGLGEVPIVPVISSESEDDTVLPHPTFYDVCRCNWAIFNYDSFQSTTVSGSLYATLVLPRPSGTEVSNLQAMNRQQGLLQPPAENGVTPSEPHYLEYPTGTFESLRAYIQDLIDDMFRQAGQLGVSAKSTKTTKGQSGVSKEYDFQAQKYVLMESSKMAKNTAEEIARFYQLYVKSEQFDFSAHFEEDYGPEENQDDDVKLYGDYIALNPGPKGKALAMKMLSHSIFDDADEKDLAEVIDEINQQLTTEQKDARDIPPEETPEEKAAREAAEALAAQTTQQKGGSQESPPPEPIPAKKKTIKKGVPRRRFKAADYGGAA